MKSLTKLVLCILLFALMPALLGLGVGLWPGGGSGGSSGPVNPATGVDSEICIGENSDHGTNTLCLKVDAATDFEQNVDSYVNLTGFANQQFVTGHVNDGAVALAVEHISWNILTMSGGTAGASYSVLNGYETIKSPTGCSTVPVALGITLGRANNGATNVCNWRVQSAIAAATNSYDNQTAGAVDAAWNLCNEHIEVGPASTNGTWGHGSGQGGGDALTNSGDYWIVPLSGCTSGVAGSVVVRVDEESAGSCTGVFDTQATLWTVEDCS